MNNEKLLKILSTLLIIVCAFGIVAGILGFISTVNIKKAKEAESSLLKDQISQLEQKTDALSAKKAEFDADTATLEQNKASYESDKAAYDMLKSAYDSKAAEFKTEKASGHIDSATLSVTQSILDQGAKKLETEKAKLTEYEAAQTFVDNYKSDQAEINSNFSKLSQNAAIAAMNNAGLTPIAAAKEALKQDTQQTSRRISAGIYLCAMSLITAVLALFASLKGMNAVKLHGNDNIKDATFLGLTSLVLAVAANVFGIMNGYPVTKLLSAAFIGETFFALLFVISAIKFRKTFSNRLG